MARQVRLGILVCGCDVRACHAQAVDSRARFETGQRERKAGQGCTYIWSLCVHGKVTVMSATQGKMVRKAGHGC
jgi:hypothetical protein